MGRDYAVADAPVEAGDADDAAIDALSADSLTLEALQADETDTGTPVDDAAASAYGEIDEITFAGSDIGDDRSSLVVAAPDDAGTPASHSSARRPLGNECVKPCSSRLPQ